MNLRLSVLLTLCVSLFASSLSHPLSGAESAASVSRVLPAGQLPPDSRLAPPRLLKDKLHPWTPPDTKEKWEAQAARVREQLLISNGLWPMPKSAPLKPVIHGKIDRDEYTIEKVYFSSFPGHYVTGSLYRPKHAKGKTPGVLSPHGHWREGRFHEATPQEISKQISQGGEKFQNAAKHPVQARHAMLARMGCTVFHYDMVGYADNKPIPHGSGFKDLEAESRLQNAMGLQTFNSICALNFLMSLPEVDTSRIGVTGQSGGGTQTFILCAIDPRPTAAFPACMISSNMQGGCSCENASYLRLDVNNITFAAMFAPRPMAMNGADDWTIDIETKGLPELKQIYGYYGKSDLVHAKCFPQFGHNYNRLAREMMYNWFNEHLKLGLPSPVEERDFVPVPPKELSVWDASHPLPADALDVKGLRELWTRTAREHWEQLIPQDAAGVEKYRAEVNPAARVLLGGELPDNDELGTKRYYQGELAGAPLAMKIGAQRKSTKEEVPTLLMAPQNYEGEVIVWIDGRGKQACFTEKGELQPPLKKLFDAGKGLILCDVFQTGEFLKDGQPVTPNVNKDFAGYTFGYNRPLISQRVRDIRTVIAAAGKPEFIQNVSLVGVHGAGPWVALAATQRPEKLDALYADLNGFCFSKVSSLSDAEFLPGALKYGGIGGLTALAAPTKMMLWGTSGITAEELKPLQAVYAAVAKEKLKLIEAPTQSDDEIVTAILKP